MYSNPVSIKRHNFILKQIEVYAHGRKLDILDIGCGQGDLSFPLSGLGHNVTGIDIDSESITDCLRIDVTHRIKFLKRDARLFKSDTLFDVVLLTEVLEHIHSPETMVEMIERVLKPNGILILTIPNGYCFTETVFCKLIINGQNTEWLYSLLRKGYCWVTGTKMSRTYPFYMDSPHCNFFSMKQIKKMFHNFRIDVIKHSDLGLIAGAGRMHSIKDIECKIADKLPHSMVGGWFMVLRKNG
jgi:ubiquinone/menaquinone biosynthesis C-methylase UbiE